MTWTEDDLPVHGIFYQHIGRLFPCHSPKVTAIFETSANIAYLTSDVVRCHQMSYQSLFTNRLSLSNFAKSESDNGKE